MKLLPVKETKKARCTGCGAKLALHTVEHPKVQQVLQIVHSEDCKNILSSMAKLGDQTRLFLIHTNIPQATKFTYKEGTFLVRAISQVEAAQLAREYVEAEKLRLWGSISMSPQVRVA